MDNFLVANENHSQLHLAYKDMGGGGGLMRKLLQEPPKYTKKSIQKRNNWGQIKC